MLLQQKAAQTAGFARQVEKRHLHLPGIKIDTFLGFEGGLPVTNDAINSITAKSQEDYYNKVRSSEEGWASTNEGQIEFQKIVNEGGRLKEQL
jgi:hypothetical protein